MFACGLFGLFGLPTLAQAKRTAISVAAESRVERETITLADVAKISGGKASALGSVSLGYAPNIGMTREISRERIALSISAAGFNSSEFSMTAPASILIRRAGQSIDSEQLRQNIENAVLAQLAGGAIEARITRLDLPPSFEVPAGHVEVRTNFANVVNFFAPFYLPVEIRVDDKIVRRLSVGAEIEAFAEILIAAKDLTAKSKIGALDARLEKRRLTKPVSSYLRDAENLRGLMLIKDISAGSELTGDSYISTIVVKSGDLVRIIGESGTLVRIIVNGEARSSGKIGDRIAVKNTQSNAIIQATVVDEGIVKVFF